ncbi:flagellar filament capping protein FliD [Orenia marismortui]|uniref:flagellar filament capping protein FliD n=1 Tax=Orenia marismortui TaxID=46469 RepID=UPI00035EEB91|nr:flagellar filament capping protein FliD [Orenia marismortui]
MGISLGGFSGIDTSSMIQQMMYIEEAPVRRMEEKQDEMNSEIKAWQEINTQLDTLKTKATDLEDIFGEMSVSFGDEDQSSITATATDGANSGSYNIQVNKLAKAHRVASTQQTDSSSDLNLNSGAGGSFDVIVNGTTMNISVTGDNSLNGVMDAINNDDQNDDGDGNKLVEASIVDNTLVIESVDTGTDNTLTFADGAEGVLQELGVVNGTDAIQNELQTAQNAEFTVDSLLITRQSNEVDDVLNGVTLNLENTTSSELTMTVGADTGAMKEKIQSFVNQYNKVINKLDKYGDKEALLQGDATLSSIQSTLYNSTVVSSDTVSSTEWLSNTPLSGGGDLVVNGTTVNLATGDDLATIASAINAVGGVTASVNDDNKIVIESDTSTPVDLSGSSSQALSDLKMPQTFEKNAISLLGVEVDKKGELSIDDDKLEDALTGDLSDVEQMFTGVNGVMDRIEKNVELATDTFEGYVSGRIDTLERQVDYLDDDIADMERRLEIREENLRQQFTAMEQAMSQMQNQGSWLSSMTGSMQ